MAATQTVTTRYRIDDELAIDDELCALAAHDVWLDRPVVLAISNPETVPTVGAAVGPPGWAAASVTHPNTLDVYDAGLDGGAPFVVVENPGLRTLADELRVAPPPPARVEQVADSLVAGLAALHDAGVTHGHLRPSAVAVSADGTPRVGPSPVGPASARTSRAPTDPYRAPELEDETRPGPAADVWSAGAVLYAAVTGAPPGPPRGMPAGHTTKLRSPSTSGVPSRVLDVIGRALAEDPDERYATAAAMGAALHGTDKTTEPTRSGIGLAGERSLMPAPRWRVAACVAVVGGALIGFWPMLQPVSGRRRATPPPPPVVRTVPPPIVSLPLTPRPVLATLVPPTSQARTTRPPAGPASPFPSTAAAGVVPPSTAPASPTPPTSTEPSTTTTTSDPGTGRGGGDQRPSSR
jgi:eukaryotic-like serine/threonine-protein kinase